VSKAASMPNCRTKLFLDGISTPEYIPIQAVSSPYGFSPGKVGVTLPHRLD
jgi:hypothetical protein